MPEPRRGQSLGSSYLSAAHSHPPEERRVQSVPGDDGEVQVQVPELGMQRCRRCTQGQGKQLSPAR